MSGEPVKTHRDPCHGVAEVALEDILDRVDLDVDVERKLDPEWHGQELTAATPRAAAVAQLRRYADLLERGELDGVRMQWREGLHHLECVELDAYPVEVDGRRVKRVQLLRYELMTPERPAESKAD